MMVRIPLPQKVTTNCGCRIAPVFEKVFDKELGREVVKYTKDFDMQEFIQASECQTDLAQLRQEMISTGQIPAVDDEVVADTSLFPENIHDLMNTVNSAQAKYDALPDSIKAIFPNKDIFLASLIDGTYTDKIVAGLYQQGQAQQTVATEVKQDE